MKFRLILKVKAEATLMMVLVLLNLTGCPLLQDDQEEKDIIIVDKDRMDELYEAVVNDSVVSAEFKYMINKERVYFKCDSVENVSENNTTSVKQWNEVVAMNILNECIENATTRKSPAPDFIKHMNESKEVMKIFTFNSNNSKIKVTSHFELIKNKPTYTFEDDEFIYTYKDSTSTQ